MPTHTTPHDPAPRDPAPHGSLTPPLPTGML